MPHLQNGYNNITSSNWLMYEANKIIMKYSMNDDQNIISTLLVLLFKYIYVCMYICVYMYVCMHACVICTCHRIHAETTGQLVEVRSLLSTTESWGWNWGNQVSGEHLYWLNPSTGSVFAIVKIFSLILCFTDWHLLLVQPKSRM